jgi:hypothetical protein
MILPPARLEKEGMAALYKNWLPKPERNIAREAFSSLPDLSRHKGFDPLDILYWEHSLPAWQGLQLQDYELSHQTVSLFNNQNLLVQLLSLPLSSRLNDEAQRSIVTCLHSDVPLPSLSSGHSMKKILRTVMFNAMSF